MAILTNTVRGRSTVVVALTASIGLLAFASRGEARQGMAGDREQINDVLEDYIVGWREADVDRLAGAFATEAGTIMWVGSQDGSQALQSMTFEAALQRRRPQPEYGLQWEVQHLDIVDARMAVAKLDISRAGGSYIDLLTLYKIDGNWKIVNKAFTTRSE